MHTHEKLSSIWRYLFLLGLMPFLVWQVTQGALHYQDVSFARHNPSLDVSMARACRAQLPEQDIKGLELCEQRRQVEIARLLAVGILGSLGLILGACVALSRAPRSMRLWAVRSARFLAGAWLLLTWSMTLAQGAALALAVWVLPMVWVGREGAGFAALLALWTICRLPRHAMAAWRLFAETRRAVVGQIADRSQAPEIWAFIDDACARLGVAKPERLILGLQPGARLDAGPLVLDPGSQPLQGRSFYLGTSLAQALDKDALRALIESALSRAAGPHGAWLPEAQDGLANARENLLQARWLRQEGALQAETEIALEAFGAWLGTIEALIKPFEEEDFAAACQRQAAGAPEMARVERDRLLEVAKRAWKERVFPRFMLALSVGEKTPLTQRRFEAALEEVWRGSGAGERWISSEEQYASLVEKECRWMAMTGQVSLPQHCWELMGLFDGHKEPEGRPLSLSMRLNP